MDKGRGGGEKNKTLLLLLATASPVQLPSGSLGGSTMLEGKEGTVACSGQQI